MVKLLVFQITVMTITACCWFAAAQVRRRFDLADIAWGIGFVIATAAALLSEGASTPRALLVSVLVLIWGVRLAVHISLRNKGKDEDPRYRKWREEWGRYAAVRSFFQVFLLQQYLVLFVLAPVTFVIAYGGGPLGALDALGALVWVTGMFFEALGDYQLLRFTSDRANKGRIMSQGLWRYTRHPNYFGEVTLWWGVYLIACAVPDGWKTIIGPATITVLILGISGIPMLEARYKGNAAFDEYKRRTSAFFPLPPKA